MKSMYFVTIKNVGVQFHWPHVRKNEFGYGLFLKTSVVIGPRTLSLSILGFGISVADMSGADKSWMLETADWKVL